MALCVVPVNTQEASNGLGWGWLPHPPKQWGLPKGLHRIHSCRLESVAFPELPQFRYVCALKVTVFAALPPAVKVSVPGGLHAFFLLPPFPRCSQANSGT